MYIISDVVVQNSDLDCNPNRKNNVEIVTTMTHGQETHEARYITRDVLYYTGRYSSLAQKKASAFMSKLSTLLG